MDTAILRGVGSDEYCCGAKPGGNLCPQLDRYRHPAWNLQATAETMARAVVAL
jgi:hypothetical protein